MSIFWLRSLKKLCFPILFTVSLTMVGLCVEELWLKFIVKIRFEKGINKKTRNTKPLTILFLRWKRIFDILPSFISSFFSFLTFFYKKKPIIDSYSTHKTIDCLTTFGTSHATYNSALTTIMMAARMQGSHVSNYFFAVFG